MDDFKRFVKECLTLEIRVLPNGLLTLDHYSQFKSDYRNEIIQMQQDAIIDLVSKPRDEMQMQLSNLRAKYELLERFWPFYESYYSSNPKISSAEVEVKLQEFFTIPRHDRGLLTEHFKKGLHDAVHFKQWALGALIEQMGKILTKENGKNLAKPEVKLCLLYFKEVKNEILDFNVHPKRIADALGGNLEYSQRAYNELTLLLKREELKTATGNERRTLTHYRACLQEPSGIRNLEHFFP
jgi:hypothetical protein